MKSILIEFIPIGNDEENIAITAQGIEREDLLDAIAHTVLHCKVNGFELKAYNIKRVK